jgi:hypothetical protein
MPSIKIERIKGTAGRPGIVEKTANLSAALTRWIAAGRPVRTPEKQAELFAICEACPHFLRGSGDLHGCGICGCGLKKSGGILNKLKWATESCPLPEPKWTAEVPSDPAEKDP